ncbi:MAG: S1C family serine protease [Actinomycetota bacterium]|nr:S1C family serine protease [Actinomycetota bacterium]
MSDNFEHVGWSEGDAAWAVPDLGQPTWQSTPPSMSPSGPPPVPPHSGPGSTVLVLVAAVVAFMLALGVGSIAARRTSDSSSSNGIAASPFTTVPPATSGSNGTDTSSPSSANAVVDKVDDAIVNITTTLGYENGAAAGTGMVLTSSGQVLTNNHVVQGATRITATVSTTGKSYTATVVGTSPTDDIALLQLDGASNLKTVTVATAAAKIGDPVVAMGNAGGQGGLPSVATGEVVALDQAITATDEGGGNARRLVNLIQVSAPIESGDSGGPLANAAGEVIGIDTAASVSGGRLRSSTTEGYAIPITKAIGIVKQIQSGVSNDQIHQGLPAFLGVQLSPTAGPVGGALVSGVESGLPADSAGIAAGDTIVSVNGTAVSSAASLSTALAGHKPGDKVTIGWQTASGSSKTAKATLATGPAD